MTKQLCPICEKQQTIVSGNKGATGKGGIKTLQLEGQHFFLIMIIFYPLLKHLLLAIVKEAFISQPGQA